MLGECTECWCVCLLSDRQVVRALVPRHRFTHLSMSLGVHPEWSLAKPRMPPPVLPHSLPTMPTCPSEMPPLCPSIPKSSHPPESHLCPSKWGGVALLTGLPLSHLPSPLQSPPQATMSTAAPTQLKVSSMPPSHTARVETSSPPPPLPDTAPPPLPSTAPPPAPSSAPSGQLSQSARYEDTPPDRDTPKYKGYSNPAVQSRSFKALQTMIDSGEGNMPYFLLFVIY